MISLPEHSLCGVLVCHDTTVIGLVQLLSGDALSSDQSAAEIAAAIDGAAKGELELAVAMYTRAQSRWRAFGEYEMAN